MTPSKTPGAPRRRAGAFDHSVGSILREARLQAGMSQSDLGRALGVTFQQVQKYEAGTNRVPASAYPVLFAKLNLSPQVLFGESGTAEGDAGPPLRSRSAVALMRAFEAMTPERRTLLLALARELAES